MPGGPAVKKSIPFLIFVLFLTALVPSASADDESLMVIVVEEDREYSVGDRVNLTIHVFYGGEYVDADEMTITVEGESTRNVSAGKTDIGRYDVSFIIGEDDVSYDDWSSGSGWSTGGSRPGSGPGSRSTVSRWRQP